MRMVFSENATGSRGLVQASYSLTAEEEVLQGTITGTFTCREMLAADFPGTKRVLNPEQSVSASLCI